MSFQSHNISPTLKDLNNCSKLFGSQKMKWLMRRKYIETETNGCHFADDIFKCILLNENVWIPTKISLKFVSKGPINNIPAIVQIMAWRRPGDKSLSEPMMVSLPTHICVALTLSHIWTMTWYRSLLFRNRVNKVDKGGKVQLSASECFILQARLSVRNALL